jgi:hypothetical protein
MMGGRLHRALVGVLAAVAASQALALAPPPKYVQFSPSATKGALYLPDPAKFPKPHVGVVVIHRNSNFLSHISTRELPARGFIVLAMNPRCDNNEAACAPWEDNALDVKQGVLYLRKEPGITKVVLLGHSGGGPTMSFYEAVAEHGVAFCQQPEKLIKCGNGLAGLPRADGIVLMDAHPGNGINAVRSLNPAVSNDDAVLRRNEDPKIDRFKCGSSTRRRSRTSSPHWRAYRITPARNMQWFSIAWRFFADHHCARQGCGERDADDASGTARVDNSSRKFTNVRAVPGARAKSHDWSGSLQAEHVVV